jgi:putative ABC transport system permease protein
MSYSLTTLWHERNRYLPGVFAVAFSALLIALQAGLLLGMFSINSIPIDHSSADIWIGNPDVASVDLGRPIPEAWLARVAGRPEIVQAEPFLQGFAHWNKPTGGTELCCVVGARLHAGSLGALRELTPAMRARLSEPGACLVDESELSRLGISGVGAVAEISGKRMRVVGLLTGFKSLAGPYVFCSIPTARQFLHLRPDQTTYVLARCQDAANAPRVVDELRRYASMSAFTSADFSLRSRLYWLTRTRAGIAIGCTAVLGLLVGAAVTSQTLYAATAAALREFAVLAALGIPRWRLRLSVLAQAFWIGIGGVVVALPFVFALAGLGGRVGAKVLLPGWLLGLAVLITICMALLAGLIALRSLRRIEPAILLR